MEQRYNMFSLPDLDKFSDPHCLPLFNNFGPNSKAPRPQAQAQHGPKTNTTEPYVTGTSVLGVKYKDGVMIAADCLASYGSLARFRDIRRISALGRYTLIGASGEYSDFQYILRLLDDLMIEDEMADDGARLSPHSIHSYLTRVLYNRRNKMDPLWGQFVIAGWRDGFPFLGLTDLRGTSYEDETIATGYGSMIARPLMRTAVMRNPNMSEEEARTLLTDCLRVLYYRDARAFDKYQIATINANGPTISEPMLLQTNWDVGQIKYSTEIKTSDFVVHDQNRVIS
eukprot:TRINITY_DN981_c0_g1_i1.p1 TRINITY_DN981_c0_g1~~TRINITY_DN981_c0_g1_i1.p1  ORF type:complete len:317 (+),score=49.52 TRINITY_DN981_c0_g1_i1:101-952(+)